MTVQEMLFLKCSTFGDTITFILMVVNPSATRVDATNAVSMGLPYESIRAQIWMGDDLLDNSPADG